jgi:hypothetical protein
MVAETNIEFSIVLKLNRMHYSIRWTQPCTKVESVKQFMFYSYSIFQFLNKFIFLNHWLTIILLILFHLIFSQILFLLNFLKIFKCFGWQMFLSFHLLIEYLLNKSSWNLKIKAIHLIIILFHLILLIDHNICTFYYTFSIFFFGIILLVFFMCIAIN